MALAASAGPLEGLAPATDALIVPGLSSGFSRRAAARCFRARALRPDHAWLRDRRVLRARLLHDAVQAVDALQLAKPRQPLAVAVDVGSRIPPTPPGVVRDSATLSRLRRSIAASWPPPEEVKPQCALHDVLRTNDVYHIKSSLNVIPYDEEHFRLARRPLRPQAVHKLVSAEAADMITHPYIWIVKDDGVLTLDDNGRDIRPYWDPLLKNNRKRVLSFLKIRCKLLDFHDALDDDLSIPTIPAFVRHPAEGQDLPDGFIVQPSDPLGDGWDEAPCGFSVDLADGFLPVHRSDCGLVLWPQLHDAGGRDLRGLRDVDRVRVGRVGGHLRAFR